MLRKRFVNLIPFGRTSDNRCAQRKADADIRALRSSFDALHEDYADLKDAHSELSRSTSQLVASQKSEISTLSRQVRLLTDELDELRHIADQRSAAYEALQAQFDELSAEKDGLMGRKEDESWGVVREELHRQAEYLRSLESTNAKATAELTILRERHTSIEVLKEQNRDLEKKAMVAEELRTKVVTLEAELEAARKEREEW